MTRTTTFELSRRKTLAALGTVGAAAAGAGLGTTAFFSDREDFTENRLTAGSLDLKVDWQEHVFQSGEGVFEGFTQAVVWTDNDPANVPENYEGLPNPEAPLFAIHEDDLGQFVANTAVDAFPDPDDDGLHDSTIEGDPYDPCTHGADTPADLDPEGGLRTLGADTWDPEADAWKPLVTIEDLKPGDFGVLTLSVHLCDNPGYLWLTGDLVEARENGWTEPEAGAEAESGDDDERITAAGSIGSSDIELFDAVKTRWWYDDEAFFHEGTLGADLQLLASGHGIPLDGDRTTGYDEIGGVGNETDPSLGERECFPGGETHTIGLLWWVPVDRGNEIQTDSVAFDLGFYTEQCRANDGAGLPIERTLTLSADSPQGRGAGFAHEWDTTTEMAHTGDGAWGTVDHGPGGLGDAVDEDGDGRLEYKQGFYFGGEFSDFDVLPAFTVGEIDEIAYWLTEPTALDGVDVYLTAYTAPEGDGDDTASWYDSRLQALPSGANGGSPSVTPGQWNRFSTRGDATNTLTWSDTGRGGNAVQPLPTLAEIQDGPIDWSAYGANLGFAHDYRDETVRALSLQTGSESGVDLEAWIDDVLVRLADGSTLRLDLEP